jgi:GMP synthase-like glutamine amidotransferase
MVGHIDERSRHVGGDYPELFGALLGDYDIELVRYAVEEGQFPDDVRECDGWLCSPSRLSVYDDIAWMPDTEELHRRIIDAEVPYVGICFGHQLLAQALGGTVERAAVGWGVGVNTYEVVDQPIWMEPGEHQFTLLASHQDQVVQVPPGASLLATSDYCPIAGLTVGERAWSIQPHPEFMPALVDDLLSRRADLVGEERVAVARAGLDAPLDRETVARWMANTFTS